MKIKKYLNTPRILKFCRWCVADDEGVFDRDGVIECRQPRHDCLSRHTSCPMVGNAMANYILKGVLEEWQHTR